MREIQLRNSSAVALVDDADFDRVAGFAWRVNAKGYVYRAGRDRTVYLHREILAPSVGSEVDHVDGDKRNNTRANLRTCSRTENARNRLARPRSGKFPTRFKGVSAVSAGRGFFARIAVNGNRTHLGTFKDEIAAALAYDEAARLHFGAFARLNFPGPKEQGAVNQPRAEQAPDERKPVRGNRFPPASGLFDLRYGVWR